MKYTAPTRHRPAHRKSSLSGCFMTSERERHEHQQRDHLLRDLQLRQRHAAGVADAVARHLQQVLEQGDAPADERGDDPRPLVEVLEVAVPGEGHEDVRGGEQRDGAHRRGNRFDHRLEFSDALRRRPPRSRSATAPAAGDDELAARSRPAARARTRARAGADAAASARRSPGRGRRRAAGRGRACAARSAIRPLRARARASIACSACSSSSGASAVRSCATALR